MKAFPVTVILFTLAASVLSAACTSTEPPTDHGIAEMEGVAGQITMSINAGLGEIRAGNQNTSRSLSTTGLSGQEAEAVLLENLLHYPWALSSVVISPQGIILTAVPETYAGIVGTNVSGHLHFQKANAARVPMVSGVFRLAEGFDGIAQSYPVFSSSGEYLGYTDITYEPYVFLGRHIDKAIRGTDYDARVVQTDGTVIYDTSGEEIGKNVVSDPVSADPALQEILARIVKETSGTGTCTFRDRDGNRNVTRTAVWDTAGIDGTEWRVVVTSDGA